MYICNSSSLCLSNLLSIRDHIHVRICMNLFSITGLSSFSFLLSISLLTFFSLIKENLPWKQIVFYFSYVLIQRTIFMSALSIFLFLMNVEVFDNFLVVVAANLLVILLCQFRLQWQPVNEVLIEPILTF